MRVLLADDTPEVCSALRLLLEQLDGYEIVGEAADGPALLSACVELGPDVVLLDYELPGARVFSDGEGLGFGGVAAVRALLPEGTLVALSVLPGTAEEALRAGADAFVCKGDPPHRLIEALEGLGR